MKTIIIAATLCLPASLVGTQAAAQNAAQDVPPLAALEPLENTHPQADAMIELGRQLFFDTRLSGDSSTSRAECHDPRFGFGDAAELSRGYPGTAHWRNSQTVVNAAYLTEGFHWDGTVPSLVHQVSGAMGASVVANIDEAMAEERIRQIDAYVDQFQQIWQKEPSMTEIAEAIAAFEHTLTSTDSPFDAFVRGEAPLSDKAGRGYFLFMGKANCIACHNGALATDQQFHNTSVPPNPTFAEDPMAQITFRVMMRSFGISENIYNMFNRDPGRFLATKDPADLGQLRTAPLRYLKYTALYMHNGIFYTLEEVVDFYDQGGTPDRYGTKSPLIQPLGLTDTEKADLVAFLESMSGTEITTDYPELPDYKARAFPEIRVVFGDGPPPMDATTRQAGPAPAAGALSSGAGGKSTSGGLTIRPSGG